MKIKEEKEDYPKPNTEIITMSKANSTSCDSVGHVGSCDPVGHVKSCDPASSHIKEESLMPICGPHGGSFCQGKTSSRLDTTSIKYKALPFCEKYEAKTEECSKGTEEFDNTTIRKPRQCDQSVGFRTSGYTQNLNLWVSTLPTDNVNKIHKTLASESDPTSQEKNDNDFRCSLCGKSCTNKSMLEIHM